MPYIIASINEIFNHNTTLYEIARSFTLVNGQDEPTADRRCVCPAYAADKMAKTIDDLVIIYYDIFLHLFISFYIAAGN